MGQGLKHAWGHTARVVLYSIPPSPPSPPTGTDRPACGRSYATSTPPARNCTSPRGASLVGATRAALPSQAMVREAKPRVLRSAWRIAARAGPATARHGPRVGNQGHDSGMSPTRAPIQAWEQDRNGRGVGHGLALHCRRCQDQTTQTVSECLRWTVYQCEYSQMFAFRL
jgi:hypothetical protein